MGSTILLHRSLGLGLRLPAPPPAETLVRKIVQIFQELRQGETLDGRRKVKSSSGTLSSAEAIGLVCHSMSLAGHFGDGKVREADLAASLHGTIVHEDGRDGIAWIEYLENVMRQRGAEWHDLYSACRTVQGQGERGT